VLGLAIAFGIAVTGATFAWAYRSRDFVKFLSGAFFVSGGVQLYFYFARVSVPVLGTEIVVTPEVSGVRSLVHLAMFVTTLYFGYLRKPKARVG